MIWRRAELLGVVKQGFLVCKILCIRLYYCWVYYCPPIPGFPTARSFKAPSGGQIRTGPLKQRRWSQTIFYWKVEKVLFIERWDFMSDPDITLSFWLNKFTRWATFSATDRRSSAYTSAFRAPQYSSAGRREKNWPLQGDRMTHYHSGGYRIVWCSIKCNVLYGVEQVGVSCCNVNAW